MCLGTWKSPPEKTKAAVIAAVKSGYRMLDCANDYDNEHVIGEALKELFAAGVVKREELFIQVVKLSLWFLSSYSPLMKRQNCGTQTIVQST